MKVVLKNLSRRQRVAKGQTIESGQDAGRPTLTTSHHCTFTLVWMVWLKMFAKSSSWGVTDVKKVGNIQLCQRRSYTNTSPCIAIFTGKSRFPLDFLWVFMDFSGFPLHFQVPQKRKVLALLGLHLCVPRPSHFSDLRFARAVATDLLLPGWRAFRNLQLSVQRIACNNITYMSHTALDM